MPGPVSIDHELGTLPWRRPFGTSFGRYLCLAFCFSVTVGPAIAWDLTLQGRVVDENDVPVRGARVRVRPAAGPARAYEAQTDRTGVFAVALPQFGDVLIAVERDDYYALKDQPAPIEGPHELQLVVNRVREVFQSANVNEETSAAPRKNNWRREGYRPCSSAWV